MSSAITKEKMAENKKQENTTIPSTYGCEILLEKTTLKEAKDTSFPTDAKLIWYTIDGENFIDLTRSSKSVNLFDFYYDKYGSGVVQKIDWGYGTVNPRSWGYKAPEGRRRR